ncbi:MAG: HlyD family secretion protein, partial [Elusimicrobia bacterium]|nr:HlyD family secretion protein [Elusimicrobiota bacterium]
MKSHQTTAPKARKWIILGLALSAAALLGLVHWLRGRHLEETDDAYIDAHVAQVNSKVSGQVVAVL